MTDTTQTTPPNGTLQSAQIVAGVPDNTSQISVSDAAGQLVSNPSLLLGNNEKLANQVPTTSQTDINAGTINGQDPKYNSDPNALDTTAHTVDQTATAGQQQEGAVATPTTKTTASDVAAQDMTGKTGTVNQNDLVDPNAATIDTSTYGQTAAGQALKDYAKQDMSNIIDTSTLAGKLLAQQLGDGNYVDSKATLKGQLDILQNEFVDPTTGQPKIPAWAAGTARNVSRIAAFTGMTGTAATAAMAQALMEASIPVAQQDSQFFQSLTLKNLDNKQQSVINNANVLSKIDMANMDARMTAAVTNAQSFMAMDMKNLDNEQQAAVINTQDRVQSILTDANAENTNRLFVAQSQNEKDKFYSSLNASIDQFNAAQTNSMGQFNATSENSTDQFNSQLEDSRQKFYQNMQFQIDTANTKWRQSLTLQNNDEKFQAAATDVKNLVGIQTEELNQLWDRSDALLDYTWKSSENQADRVNQIALMKIQQSAAVQQSEETGAGSLLGTLLGIGGNLLMGAFGF